MNSFSQKKPVRFLSLTIGQWLLFLFFSVLIIFAVFHRIAHTYLEDDMLWLVPLVSQILDQHPFFEALKIFHTGELNFTDGIYTTLLLSVFGLNFKAYAMLSVCLHFINASLFYLLLKNRIGLSQAVSFFAALIYLAFYGHVHVYVWPLAAHHLVVAFFIFLITNLYLKTESLWEAGQAHKKYYWITLFFSLLACWQRLSILIIPVSIFIHSLFTARNKSDLIRKYNRWSPLFAIFFLYQTIVLVHGAHGAILNAVLNPFYSLVGKYQGILSSFITGIIVVIGVIISRFLLALLLKKSAGNPLARPIGRISFLLLLWPKALFLCLYTFLVPLVAMQSVDTLARWQPISFPQNSLWTGIGLVATLLLLVNFLIFTVKKNNHLVIFAGWYLLTIPYLHNWIQAMPSKYLVYVSPIFALVFSLAFFETLPSYVAPNFRDLYLKCAAVVVGTALFFNVLGIKIQLHRSLLADYHWSYDYIKISDLIADDIKANGYSLTTPICVSGIKELPYADKWQSNGLKDKNAAFRQILLSALPSKKTEIHINAACPDPSLTYRFNGHTVETNRGESIDPFYRYFKTGMQTLKDGRNKEAQSSLDEAVHTEPFLMQMLLGESSWSRFFENILLKNAADAVFAIYSRAYDGDTKINAIDTLVRNEAQDYGKALLTLAYLKDKDGNHVAPERLLKRGYLFVTKKGMLNFISQLGLKPTMTTDLNQFFNDHADLWAYQRRKKAGIEIEKYKGINIFRHADFYFGLPERNGPIDLAGLKAGGYPVSFVAKAKFSIRNWADSLTSQESTAMRSREELVYRGFRIMRTGDQFFVFDRGRPERSLDEDVKQGPVFSARSLLEIKLAIDQFLKL